MTVPIIISLVAFLTVISAWYQWMEAQKSKNEAKVSEQKADSLNKENKELLYKISELSLNSNDQIVKTGKE